MADKHASADKRRTDDDLSGEEKKLKRFHTDDDGETVSNAFWDNDEKGVIRNESSAMVKEVYHVNEDGGTSLRSRFVNEFEEAASRLPKHIRNVSFVVKNVVHGNTTRENIMYKQEVGEGGLINTQVMAQENKPREQKYEEKSENRADHLIDKIHKQVMSMEDIEMELDGLEKPNEVIPPDMTETTKDAIVRDSAMDEKYYPTYKEFIKPKGNEKQIPYEELVRDKKGCVITGPAGSGKSTMLKKFVKDVIKEEKKNVKKCINRKLVLHVELKLLRYEKNINSNDALLNAASRGTVEPEDRAILIEWINRNPKKLVIALDGYDQIPKNITEDDELPKDGYRNSTMNQYLYGILTGKVFHGALVVLSTREYALQNIPYDCIPQRVIKLIGLCHVNIDKLVVQLSDANVLNAIKNSDRVLYFLCSSPLFLTLVTRVYSDKQNNPPETKSGILMYVVLNFLTSSNIRGRLQKFFKLAELALYGIQNFKIVFTYNEIAKYGLQQQDLKDMVIAVPRDRKYIGSVKKIMAGNYQQYFVHQMIQEILASLKIILMDVDQFGDYFGRLKDDNFEEVAQLTYGLLFRNENKEMLSELADTITKGEEGMGSTQEDRGEFEKLTDLSQHRTIALKHLKARLDNGRVYDQQTFRLLYESGDTAIIQNHVKEVHLELENEFDCFCLGKVLEKSREISALWLQDASEEFIKILIQSCEKIPKIDSLGIGGDSPSPLNIGKYCGKLSNHANRLKLWNCKFTKEGLNSFVDEIGKNKKFSEAKLHETFVELEHLDGLKDLMTHVNGILQLHDVGFGVTNISSEVKKKIPRQYQGCTVEYWSEHRRTVRSVPQIEAEQPTATEGNIPRLNQNVNESENEIDSMQGPRRNE